MVALLVPIPCEGFSSSTPSITTTKKTTAPSCSSQSKEPNNNNNNNRKKHYPIIESFSVPFMKERPQPKTFGSTLNQLWNDPRPVTSLVGDAVRSGSSSNNNNNNINGKVIPYCLWSDEFLVDRKHKFRLSLFPRGRFAAALSSTSSEQPDEASDSGSDSNVGGYAAAYLRYIPNEYGDEVDIGWRLRLVDTRTNTSIPIVTSGGLPKSNTTWSAAMTFTSDNEDIESCGRCADWGSSTWLAAPVCNVLLQGGCCIEARGEITLYNNRTGESSFSSSMFQSFPLLKPKGAIKAVIDSRKNAGRAGKPTGEIIINSNGDNGGDGQQQNNSPVLQERSFRVGEVIVPMTTIDIKSTTSPISTENNNNQLLREESSYCSITSGTDYRIMTMSAKDGTSIFSTNDVPQADRKHVRLAIRPCGWKLQAAQVARREQSYKLPTTINDWPVEVEAGLLSTSALSRFNTAAAIPRVTATFQRDTAAVLFSLLLAISPIPAALVARNFVSLYAIPSASMDPTLQKGDVLLVEKLPNVFGRTSRGDIVLFRPPLALQDIINGGGSSSSSTNRPTSSSSSPSNTKSKSRSNSNPTNSIGSKSLFVKRVVGLPGDINILLDPITKEISIDGSPAVGPDRNLCEDEPLRLIDRFLETGKGKSIEQLSNDEVFVLGDCKDVSIDSRVFGVLPKDNIEGKPLGRIWPPSRITFRQL